MQIENDYDKEVYNGDIGNVGDVDPEAGEVTVKFDGRAVTYGFGELDVLVPAYAATIHKSQGSEYPAVIIPVLTQHYPMLQRNLSTPASPAASDSSSWSARRRRSPSRSATHRAGDAGRSPASGSRLAHARTERPSRRDNDWRWASQSSGSAEAFTSETTRSDALQPHNSEKMWSLAVTDGSRAPLPITLVATCSMPVGLQCAKRKRRL